MCEGVRKLISQRVWVRLLCWGFKGVLRDSVGGGQHLSNRVSGISTRTIHQFTTPSLSQTIWPRWSSRQFLSLHVVQTLVPVTFGYSLSSRAVVWDNWENERGCDEGHWHAHPKELPWDLPKGVRAVQVHCSRRRLLWRGLEFHVFILNKMPIRKKSGNL